MVPIFRASDGVWYKKSATAPKVGAVCAACVRLALVPLDDAKPSLEPGKERA